MQTMAEQVLAPRLPALPATERDGRSVLVEAQSLTADGRTVIVQMRQGRSFSGG